LIPEQRTLEYINVDELLESERISTTTLHSSTTEDIAPPKLDSAIGTETTCSRPTETLHSTSILHDCTTESNPAQVNKAVHSISNIKDDVANPNSSRMIDSPDTCSKQLSPWHDKSRKKRINPVRVLKTAQPHEEEPVNVPEKLPEKVNSVTD
jgi:hypothetical protein